MFNINKIMQAEYRPADNSKIKNKFYQLKLIPIILRILFIQLCDSFTWILKLFKPQKRENISSKLALITGGGNGLGRVLAFRLAQEGCDIAIADIDYKAACKTALEVEEKFGVLCKAFHCDVSEKTEIYKLKNDVESEMRGVDILVNNAGLIYVSNFFHAQDVDIEKTAQVNFTAPMILTRTFLPGMVERKYGRILTICSIASIIGGPLVAVYAATKRGLDGFMRSVGDDILMAGHDDIIKLTTVYPDFIHTRQEISTILDKINHFLPRLTPERVAEDAVRGFLSRKRYVYSSDITLMYYAMKILTKNAKKYISSSIMDVSEFYNTL